MIATSHCEPEERKQRFVVAGGASESVIVAGAAVVARIAGVLQAETQVEPRACEGIGLAERYVLESQKVAAAAGGAGFAAAIRSRSIEAGSGSGAGIG